MSKLDAGLSVRINIKTGDYAIVNFAIDMFGMLAAWGPLVYVSKEQMEQEGLKLVIQNLEGFYERDCNANPCELNGNPSFSRKFEKQHRYVSVSLHEQRCIFFDPMHRKARGGADSEYEDVVVLPYPCTQAQFLEALRLSESRAT